jgi:hypothetical protein
MLWTGGSRATCSAGPAGCQALPGQRAGPELRNLDRPPRRLPADAATDSHGRMDQPEKWLDSDG